MSSIQEEITRGLQTTAKSTQESVNELAIQVCKLTAAVGSGQHTVEVASVIRTALSILASTTPGLSPEARLQILFQQLTNQPSTELRIDPTASKVGTPVAQDTGRGIRPTDKPPAKVLEVASWPWGQPAAKSDLAQVLGLKPITNVSPTQTHIVNHRPEDPVGNRARRVIAEQLGLTIDEVTDDKSVVADFGADSLDLVELCMAFEDEFHVVDTDKGRKVSLAEALEYWKRHNP